MAGGRGERVNYVDFLDQGEDPTEEGYMQRNGQDVKVFVSGQARSIFSGDDAFSLFNAINESYELAVTETDGVASALLAHVPSQPAQKIREVDNLTCDADGMITGMRIRQYGSDRTTVVETMTLTGGNVWTKT